MIKLLIDIQVFLLMDYNQCAREKKCSVKDRFYIVYYFVLCELFLLMVRFLKLIFFTSFSKRYKQFYEAPWQKDHLTFYYRPVLLLWLFLGEFFDENSKFALENIIYAIYDYWFSLIDFKRGNKAKQTHNKQKTRKKKRSATFRYFVSLSICKLILMVY